MARYAYSYCGPQCRPENNARATIFGLSDVERAEIPDEATEQLGLKVWHSYGSSRPKREMNMGLMPAEWSAEEYRGLPLMQ